MKKKIIALLIMVITLILCTGYAFAETTSSTTKTITIPESMLTDTQKAELAKQNTEDKIKQYGQWVGLGQEIGTAVDSSLGALTSRAEEFANTKVGMFTMFIVAYKVIGTDAIQLVIGIPLLIFSLIIWSISFYKSCIPHKVVRSKEGFMGFKKKEYNVIGDEDDEKIGYFIVILIVIGACCLIIFA